MDLRYGLSAVEHSVEQPCNTLQHRSTCSIDSWTLAYVFVYASKIIISSMLFLHNTS